MKRYNSLKLFVLISSVIGSANARSMHEECEGPLQARRWFVDVKAGAASAWYAKRGNELQVVPRAGIADCPFPFFVAANNTLVGPTTVDLPCGSFFDSPLDVLQESCCKVSRFNDMFSNGVLHVGGEIGYNVGEHCQYFVDLIYNRANGSCVSATSKNIRALDGCCDQECNSSCGSPLSSTYASRKDSFGNYSAFGAYIGNRYFFNRIWCDRLAFFLGLKVGVMHRREVCATSTFPAVTANSVTIFAERNVTNIALCQSSAISGGLQVGGDYCINDCLTFMIGLEVVATSPLKSNNNVALGLPTPVTGQTSIDPTSYYFPTNIIRGTTGTLLQFPVWAGLRWEWEFCRNSCN